MRRYAENPSQALRMMYAFRTTQHIQMRPHRTNGDSRHRGREAAAPQAVLVLACDPTVRKPGGELGKRCSKLVNQFDISDSSAGQDTLPTPRVSSRLRAFSR